MQRRSGRHLDRIMSLDSLVDIVSNIVGILVILAAFMALLTLLKPLDLTEPWAERAQRRIPKKLLVPWAHPTTKNRVLLSLRENRVQFFDLRPFYLELSRREAADDMKPVTVKHKGYEIRFFPVTTQIYCMEFVSKHGAGENWLEAQRAGSDWTRLLREFPPEKYVLFFWVDTGSFELFRQIRQDLWEKNFEVGWKPAGKEHPLEFCDGFGGSNAFRPQ